ncbi:hypothetical protein DVH05_027305 [Phytophthora capsici]|nr:hypothetical protein DVH05_027305 [Phytophthora capsici]
MKIIAVDRWLQFAVVDEDESEAVAISCVEFLLEETNAYYEQKCLNRDAVQSVSFCLRDNILNTVFAAALEKAEEPLDDDRFKYESRPEAEVGDRHAVRCVPSKSIEKPVSIRSSFPVKTASSPASRADSSPDKLRTRTGARRRRKPSIESDKMPPVQTFELEGDPDYEKPEIKAWREKCLKSLETSTKKPGFAKWANLARAFAVPESRVSMEVGVIASPPANVVEALAATPVQTKTNIDIFSSIFDSREAPIEDISNSTTRRTTRRPSTAVESTARNPHRTSTTILAIAEVPQRQAKRLSQSANTTDSSLQRRATLLTDSLSRRKLTRKPSTCESLSGNNGTSALNSSRSLWRYEHESDTTTFIADGSEFAASTLQTTMSVASGVVMMQGENVVEGPEWVENATTMSRKRFDLQQQLAADALLNAPPDFNTPRCSSLGSPSAFGHSPLSALHFRDYEEVPPEPIPIPQLSPISTSTLAIPRTVRLLFYTISLNLHY